MHVVDNEGNIKKECCDRESIETEISAFNMNHFTQANHSKMRKDKICNKLLDDDIRNRTLTGQSEY